MENSVLQIITIVSCLTFTLNTHKKPSDGHELTYDIKTMRIVVIYNLFDYIFVSFFV